MNYVRLTVPGAAILLDDAVHDGIRGAVLNAGIRTLAAGIEVLKRWIRTDPGGGKQDPKAHHRAPFGMDDQGVVSKYPHAGLHCQMPDRLKIIRKKIENLVKEFNQLAEMDASLPIKGR